MTPHQAKKALKEDWGHLEVQDEKEAVGRALPSAYRALVTLADGHQPALTTLHRLKIGVTLRQKQAAHRYKYTHDPVLRGYLQACADITCAIEDIIDSPEDQ